MALSPLLKQPTAVTLPLKKVSNERMGLSGLAISMILTELFMPTTILSLAYVISMQLGAEVIFMVSLGLQFPVEGSQNLMVLS
jgi:hypothetical protein